MTIDIETDKPECMEEAALSMAVAFDEAAAILGLVDAGDREGRLELRLKAYDLLAGARRRQAVHHLAADLDAEINKQAKAEPFATGETLGFFPKAARRPH